MSLTVLAIRLLPDRVTPSVVFHAASALYDCSSLEMTSNGPLIRRNWPSLSAGEELLWSVLAWINDQGDLPSMAELEARLDEDNLTAIRKTFERMGHAA